MGRHPHYLQVERTAQGILFPSSERRRVFPPILSSAKPTPEPEGSRQASETQLRAAFTLQGQHRWTMMWSAKSAAELQPGTAKIFIQLPATIPINPRRAMDVNLQVWGGERTARHLTTEEVLTPWSARHLISQDISCW